MTAVLGLIAGSAFAVALTYRRAWKKLKAQIDADGIQLLMVEGALRGATQRAESLQTELHELMRDRVTAGARS